MKLAECDRQINAFLKEQINTDPAKKKLSTTSRKHKRQNKIVLKGLALNQAAYQYFEGVDQMQIEGVSHSTILSIMSEIGPEGFQKFETAKQFAS